MRKVLFTSHTANFCKFNRPFMRWFKARGWQVDYACAMEEDIYDYDNAYEIPFSRTPWSYDNLVAYRRLKALLAKNHYDIIHTHTPMGSVITRMAARNTRRNGTKILYTAHGFHFYKGAPLKNWLLYYPVEKFLAGCTDCLILLNDEDAMAAKRHHFKAGAIEKIDGVGVDLRRFEPMNMEQRVQKRREMGLGESDEVLVCVAEFIPRKDHLFLIEQVKLLHDGPAPGIKLLLLGQGELKNKLMDKVHNDGMDGYVYFLGYRSDVNEVCAASDILVSASEQEGLPMNIIEAMATGIPIVCTDIRGQRDLISDGKNGYMFSRGDGATFRSHIIRLLCDPELRESIGRQNTEDARKYSLDRALDTMAAIYMRYM